MNNIETDAKIQIQNIADAYSKVVPQNEKYYQSNANNYIAELGMLDFKIKKELSICSKDFVAFHDVFSYFALQYGLNQHSVVASINPHGEVTVKSLENIINTAKKFDIKIIFSEEMANLKTSQIIADEINGKVIVLSPLEVDDCIFIEIYYMSCSNTPGITITIELFKHVGELSNTVQDKTGKSTDS